MLTNGMPGSFLINELLPFPHENPALARIVAVRPASVYGTVTLDLQVATDAIIFLVPRLLDIFDRPHLPPGDPQLTVRGEGWTAQARQGIIMLRGTNPGADGRILAVWPTHRLLLMVHAT